MSLQSEISQFISDFGTNPAKFNEAVGWRRFVGDLNANKKTPQHIRERAREYIATRRARKPWTIPEYENATETPPVAVDQVPYESYQHGCTRLLQAYHAYYVKHVASSTPA